MLIHVLQTPVTLITFPIASIQDAVLSSTSKRTPGMCFPGLLLEVGRLQYLFCPSFFLVGLPLHRPDTEKTAGKCDMDPRGWKSIHYVKRGIYLRTSCAGCTRLLSLHLPKRHVKPLRVKAVISQEHLVIFIGQKLKSPIELEYSAIGKEGLASNLGAILYSATVYTGHALLLLVVQKMTQT